MQEFYHNSSHGLEARLTAQKEIRYEYIIMNQFNAYEKVSSITDLLIRFANSLRAYEK